MIYIATGEAGDAEMAERIAHHRAARGPAWTTIEEPVDLARVLRAYGRAAAVRSRRLHHAVDQQSDGRAGARSGAAVEDLCQVIAAAAGDLCLVSNEVGLGIVPDNPLARQFRDEAGLANQRLAAMCQQVVFMVGGLAVRVK